MTGKIFVHIGLPKTATTTLQTDVFPALSTDKIEYIGIFQPRDMQAVNKLMRDFSAAVYSGFAIDALRKELMLYLDSGNSLILSEEMFTVSQKGVSWRDKLKHLSEILQYFDYELILSVREPVSAMFSYYVELYEQFYIEKISFIDAALYDDRMHIYHYKKLTDVMFKLFDHDRVHVFKFEDMVENGASGVIKLIRPSDSGLPDINFGNHNQKIKIGNFVYAGSTVTLVDIFRRVFVFFGLNNTKLIARLRITLKPIVLHLDNISVKRKVPIPTQEVKLFLKEKLAGETAALVYYFGINYG